MPYKIIDMDHYARRDHFNYFRSLPYPYAGVTVDVDVTALVKFSKAHHYSFYLLFLHAAALAADDVPELRRRIRDGGIAEYDACPTSHIELLDNGTYCYCTLKHHMPTEAYMSYAESARKQARETGSIEEDDDFSSLYLVSTVPWLRYTSLIQPVAGGDESNPRITWGKYEEDMKGRLMMPVSILVHHALVDGIHLAAFYQNIPARIAEITRSCA